MDVPIDEIVKNLLKFVVRGFYGGSYVLVLDAIIYHSVLVEEDLKQLLSINKTELGPLIARLRSDRLVSTHKQREYPPNSKSVERCYYYIKYPHAVDSIKWKVHQLVQRMKEDLDKNSEPNGYMCPICLTKYTQLEAIQLLNYERTEFLCSLCDEPLIEDDSGKKNKEKQDKLNRLMDQIQPIIDYLKKIDDSRIEENTFELALARLIPPQNQLNAAYTFNPKKGSTMFKPGETTLDANSIMGNSLGNDSSRRAGANSQATLHVNITTANDEIVQRQLQERQAEEKRKQNAVPEWHQQSTIGKTALGRLDSDEEFDPQTTQQALQSTMGGGSDVVDEESTYGYNNNLTANQREEKENERTLNEYYAALARKQAKAKKEEEEEEEEEMEDVNDDNVDGNDDDEDGFEDVVTGNNGTTQNQSEDSEDNEDIAAFEDEFEDVMDESDEKKIFNGEDKNKDDDMDIEFEDV
ncbi:Transcription initiation factor IIE subunit alpha [Nakaseomyces glabratus]|nr:Transcription initiation factor IIE subunit alpha [Nakaseomyces glabratus]KTB25703.1 Transcription initiation factor IIE subunit alpha [Nakaseomyces glabratus]